MSAPRPLRGAVAMVAAWVVGCAPVADHRGGVESPSAARSPADVAPGGARLDLEHHVVDPRLTTPLLGAATDGREILFSSGVADGPDSRYAPDLYRYAPDTGEAGPLWRNPDRRRHLLPIEVDRGRYAFVDYPPTDAGAPWNLFVLPEVGGPPILLDREVRQAGVRTLVPSFDLDADRIAWTAFDAGIDGPVSELWLAEAPDWRPQRLHGLPLAEGELWLPSLDGPRLAYVELRNSADRTDDERRVMLMDLAAPDAPPRRLDGSGLATMPVLHGDRVIWKENAEGFNMFSWGRLWQHSLADGSTSRLTTAPQRAITSPSVGSRFVAYWGIDATILTVHDLEAGASRIVERLDPTSHETLVRAHVGGDLLIWLHGRSDPDGRQLAPLELTWAQLPVRDDGG